MKGDALKRAAVRWLVNNQRRTAPCGCLYVNDPTEDVGARRVFACRSHRVVYDLAGE